MLARLKDHFGGDSGHGSFPTWKCESKWQEEVVEGGRRSALHGLDQCAKDLIYAAQPLHREKPAEDPLVILNTLDNEDKHRLLHPAFVYPEAEQGSDLIEVLDREKVIGATNLWSTVNRLTTVPRYTALIDRVRGIANEAAALIDGHRCPPPSRH